ncbi:serine protease [Corynebacterium sp. HMSC074C01]|uniref:serine protease n=1 Tax=Corynebacterium sp. HMSC074C01 TaxID=1739482 RepID=UPI000AEA8469|nr:serine protease [Corynebacterium sp. HMSC074C01]
MNSYPAAVKIRTRRSYCSGVLIDASLKPCTQQATRLVLTCAHFFRDGLDKADHYKVSGGFNRRITAVRTIDGTDMALCLLDTPAPPRNLPGLAHSTPSFRAPVSTWGYGGRARRAQKRTGLFLLPFFRTWSVDFLTTVSPAGFVFNTNPAVKGDSGGPALIDDAIIGTQALILNPLGRNLKLATVALIAPHRTAIAAAAAALLRGSSED